MSASAPHLRLHPVVELLSPNGEQRRAIASTARVVVVSAGAGTGKTRTLVARYLAHLAEGLPLRSVVAVTFTRKAAREMRSRVRQAVRDYLARPDLPPAERRTWLAHYRDLDAARIGTLHGLCSEILRTHPAETGLDPRSGVLDEGPMNLLRAEARDVALNWAADRPALAPLFSAWGERDLAALLDDLLARAPEVEEAFSTLGDAPSPERCCERWAAQLEVRQQQALRDCVASDAWQGALAVLRSLRPLKSDDAMALQVTGALEAAVTPWSCPAEAVAALAPLDGIRLGVGSAAAWPGGRGDKEVAKAALGALREAWRGIKALMCRSVGPQDVEYAALLPPLRDLFAEARRAYAALKDGRRVLDPDDLECGALALLRGSPQVLRHWRCESASPEAAGEVRALLVDEFQDTNARQMALLELLRGPGARLFAVGDAKQSIYRFRGADVTVFRALRQRAEAEGDSALTLEVSYRAHGGLVDALNALLRPVLGEVEDPTRPWVEPFSRLVAERPAGARGLRAPYVEMHLALGTKGDGALDRAAHALAARLVTLVQGGGVLLGEGAEERPVGYGDVAILCRSSSSFAAYEDALDRAGIPYVTVAGRGFYERPEVRDLLNALAALANPTDNHRLVGLLRSPAVGVSDVGLYRLASAAAERRLPMWDVLDECGGSDGPAKRLEDLLPRDSECLERGAALVRGLGALVGRVPVAALLKRLLDETGYRAALLHAGDARGARNVAKLLDDARASGLSSVGEFLEYVGGLRDTGVREGEARVLAEGAVQIMSVHQAKGLEFPIVAIGDVGYDATSHKDRLLVDADLGVLPPRKDDDGQHPVALDLGCRANGDREAAEEDRLLYVAATRAAEHLFLSGCATLDKAGRLSRLNGWLKQLLSSAGLEGEAYSCDEAGCAVHTIVSDVADNVPLALSLYEPLWSPEGNPAAERPSGPSPATRPPLLLWRASPPEPQAEESGRVGRQRSSQRLWRVVPEDGATRGWRGVPSILLGRVVHEALARWEAPWPGFAEWAEGRGRSYGLADPRALYALGERSRTLVERFRESALYAEMDAAERRLHEVDYVLRVGDVIERGKVDALYLTGGVWTIVEFKTDHIHSDDGLRGLLRRDDYVAQAERYVSAVRELLRTEPRALLCLLDYSGAVQPLALEDVRMDSGAP